MTLATNLKSMSGRAVGVAEYTRLAALGRLSDRFPSAYLADARLSMRRLRKLLAAQEFADRGDPRSLRWNESSRFSQNGEDGVIEEIFRRIGIVNAQFVEIGASDGTENCR